MKRRFCASPQFTLQALHHWSRGSTTHDRTCRKLIRFGPSLPDDGPTKPEIVPDGPLVRLRGGTQVYHALTIRPIQGNLKTD